MSMVGPICKKDFEVERFDLPTLRGGGRRGRVIHRPVGKAVGNLLGCLYVRCVGCGAARSLLLFGYVLVLCSEPPDLHLFPSFAFASWLPQAVE